MTWTWEYYDGAYIVRRIDMTKQVAYIAPRTAGNNAALRETPKEPKWRLNTSDPDSETLREAEDG